MVQFNEKSFTVDVVTGILPNENYVNTVNDIIDLLQCANSEMKAENNFYYLLELLRAMMPDEGQVKKICA